MPVILCLLTRLISKLDTIILKVPSVLKHTISFHIDLKYLSHPEINSLFLWYIDFSCLEKTVCSGIGADQENSHRDFPLSVSTVIWGQQKSSPDPGRVDRGLDLLSQREKYFIWHFVPRAFAYTKKVVFSISPMRTNS